MRAVQFFAGALTALTLSYTSPLQADSQQNNPPCSNFNVWAQSSYRAMFVNGRQPSSAARDKIYTQFMDGFWRDMDKLPKAKTVAGVFNNIQTAFQKSAGQYNESLKSHGITPQIVIDDFDCGVDRKCKDRIFTLPQLKSKTTLTDNAEVQKLIGGSARYKSVKVYVGFSRDKFAGVVFSILDGIEANLTMQSPANNIIPDKYNTEKSTKEILGCLADPRLPPLEAQPKSTPIPQPPRSLPRRGTQGVFEREA